MDDPEEGLSQKGTLSKKRISIPLKSDPVNGNIKASKVQINMNCVSPT